MNKGSGTADLVHRRGGYAQYPPSAGQKVPHANSARAARRPPHTAMRTCSGALTVPALLLFSVAASSAFGILAPPSTRIPAAWARASGEAKEAKLRGRSTCALGLGMVSEGSVGGEFDAEGAADMVLDHMKRRLDRFLNPTHHTLNPKPSTLNPKPETLNPEP